MRAIISTVLFGLAPGHPASYHLFHLPLKNQIDEGGPTHVRAPFPRHSSARARAAVCPGAVSARPARESAARQSQELVRAGAGLGHPERRVAVEVPPAGTQLLRV